MLSALWVTSTGLDLVVVLDKHTGALQEVLHADGKDPWHRFSRSVDWRQVHSTRPHDFHPNYVFWLDDEPWVTRCTPEDAVPLRNPRRAVKLSGTRGEIAVHDGVVQSSDVGDDRNGLLDLCPRSGVSRRQGDHPSSARRDPR